MEIYLFSKLRHFPHRMDFHVPNIWTYCK